MKDALVEQIAGNLAPMTPVRGEEKTWLLEDRMRHYGVPAVSFAVIDQGRMAVAAAFGTRVRDESSAAVDPQSLFQAASMSKPLAALAIMRAVETGRFDLDRDINRYLRSWRIPDSPLTSERPVTLRRILSHTAGLTVWGFGGYEPGQTLPSLPQVLSGLPPANSPPVVVDVEPGTVARYSGGGTTIAQLALEESYGESFERILAREVLKPLGMESSTFAQPLPLAREGNAAVGHDWDGNPLPGRWHVYSEAAAAGLWTTAADYLRFLLCLQRSHNGSTEQLISPATAREIATVPPGGSMFGLGPKIIGRGRARRFQHGGSNAGYKCGSNAFLDGSRGAVVLTNGDNGAALAEEVFISIARVFDWPDYLRAPREKTHLGTAELEARVGAYRLDPGAAFEELVISRDGGVLNYRLGTLPGRPLFAETATRFFSPDSLYDVQFRLDDRGRTVAMDVLDGDRVVLHATKVD
jgi:CubicO group peptidase (beta-lactamase class C family)